MALQYISGVELGRKRAKAKRQARRNARHGNPRGAAAPRLVDTKPNLAKVKLFPLGFDAPTTGLAFTLAATAQNAFEPIRGIMQASVTLDTVELTQLDVGNISQLTVKNKRFPGQMFSPASDDVLCDLNVIPPGIDFSIEGYNMDAATQRILCGWYGWYFESVNLG